MEKLVLRDAAHVMPAIWTEDGEECVSDRVFNGWGPKIVHAVNAHDDLLAACKAMLNAYAPRAEETVAIEGENVLHPAVQAARAAIAKAEAAQ